MNENLSAIQPNNLQIEYLNSTVENQINYSNNNLNADWNRNFLFKIWLFIILYLQDINYRFGDVCLIYKHWLMT